MSERNTFMVKACRCVVCGRILTSPKSVADGYGSSCSQHARRAAAREEELRDQISLFPEDNKEESHAGE